MFLNLEDFEEDDNGVNLCEVVKKELVITETYWEYV